MFTLQRGQSLGVTKREAPFPVLPSAILPISSPLSHVQLIRSHDSVGTHSIIEKLNGGLLQAILGNYASDYDKLFNISLLYSL